MLGWRSLALGPLLAPLTLLVVASAAPAQEARQTPLPPLICGGDDPTWKIDLTPDAAFLTFGPSQQFDVPQSTSAEGADWPRAYTLVTPDYTATAILLLDRGQCAQGATRAHVLTQAGTTPVLLSGCCDDTRP